MNTKIGFTEAAMERSRKDAEDFGKNDIKNRNKGADSTNSSYARGIAQNYIDLGTEEGDELAEAWLAAADKLEKNGNQKYSNKIAQEARDKLGMDRKKNIDNPIIKHAYYVINESHIDDK